MSAIDEINKSLFSFLKQQTIYEAQIKALKNILYKRATDKSSRPYLLHIISLLNKDLQDGKLSSIGKRNVILAINPQGEIKISNPQNKKVKEKKYPKKGRQQKDTSNRKRKGEGKKVLQSYAQKDVLEYFERCNYSFEGIERGRIKFKHFRNRLLEISKRDPVLFEKFKSAKDFEEVKRNLPKQEVMKELIKLHSFELNSSKDHPLSSSSSIYAISIPMGGRNK